MLLEYLMMMLFLFGLTTVEKSGSNAFVLDNTTTQPLHQQQRPSSDLQQHVPPSLSLSTSPLLSHSPSLHYHQHHQHEHQQQQQDELIHDVYKPDEDEQHELSNIILDGEANAQPQFDNTTEREVIAAVGTTARLHCRVQNLGDRAVSWIRKRDLHILTIGIMTYTNDQRFLARHIDDSDEWVLKVVSVQPRDAGIYECQVSTEPKISQAYKLMVVTSRAQILANRELFIQRGSDINLTCIAPQAPGPYTHMMWFKDSELINDSPRGGIRVVSEQQMKTSNLVIARVLNTDSGNYTCAADNSNSDSVFVHIIKSEQHAAMQHEHAVSIQAPKMFLVLLVFFYMLEFVVK